MELGPVTQTVVSAVLIYVLGQITQRFVLNPLAEQRKTIGEIASALLYLGNLSNVAAIRARGQEVVLAEEPEQASRTLRALGARLRASLWTIPLYPLWALLRLVPSRKRVLVASRGLVRWSNSLYNGGTQEHMENMRLGLRLPSDE